jgi:protein O-mannosyl-transferase
MNNAKPKEMIWKDLLQSIVENKDGGTRYAFLLGAGASISSEIPAAKVLASRWLEQIKENNPDGYEKLTQRPEYKKGNIAALYTEVYPIRFPIPGDGHRAIEKIMSDKKVQPNIGYSILAQVMNKTRHNLVLTTNFDRLTETALLFYQNVHARVIAHETMLDVVAIDDQHPSIAKVHRDMFFSPISTEDGVGALSGRWPEIIKGILSQYHVIAIGYGGNDGGLMKVLSEALQENPNAQMYWCHMDGQMEKLQEFSAQAMSRVISVKIPSFDVMMYVLGEKLDYPPLSEQFIEIAKERKQTYDAQIGKLGNRKLTVEDPEVSEAVLKLVAETWGEVEWSVQETQDLNEKESLYLEGIKKFPESHELIGNFARFLHIIKKDYPAAERHYKKALEIDPDHNNNNGNYAIFLNDIRKDHDGAERHYKKAIEINPMDVNHNGNYAAFLLARGRSAEAKPFFEIAEKYCDNKPLELELHFYRLAHFPETAEASRKAIKKLLKEGVRSLGWDFSQNIEQAEKAGCTYVEELRELAEKISAVE